MLHKFQDFKESDLKQFQFSFFTETRSYFSYPCVYVLAFTIGGKKENNNLKISENQF